MKTRTARFVPAILIFCFVLAAGSMARAQSNPVPFVNAPLVPDAVAPGAAGFTLTVNGTGFVASSVVNWNGSPRPTTFVSQSQLTAAIAAADVAVGHTATVTVGNPGVSELSNPTLFQVMAPESAISLNSTSTTVTGPPGGHPLPVATGDFNGDGKPDLAIGDPLSARVFLFLGNGDGTFQAGTVLQAASDVFLVATGDFNGDGKADLLVNTEVFLGNGDGTFQAPMPIPNEFPIGAGVVLGDFNRDGKIDLAYAVPGNLSNGEGNYVIALGNGDGTFQQTQEGPAFSGNATGIAVGDFNGDGILDLALTTSLGQVQVLFGKGDGSFSVPSIYTVDSSLESVAIVTADFNGDGVLDLAVLNAACPGSICSTPGTTAVLLGNSGGSFQPAVEYMVPGGGTMPTGIVAGDVNGDGKLDLAFTFQDAHFQILLGNGDGTFTFPSTAGFELLGCPSFVVAADFNGDGLLDFVTTDCFDGGFLTALQVPIVPSLPSVSFPAQLVGTTSVPHPVTLKNTGKTTISLAGVKINGPGSFGQTNTCGTTLVPGHSCNTKLTFAPTVAGLGTAFVSVTNTPGATVNLSGIGTALKVSPAALNFGNVQVGKTSSPITVTLSNVSSAAISISGLAVHGTNSNEFRQTDTCGSTLAGNASCTVTVTFRPSAKGAQRAIIAITDSDPASPQKVGLAGTGT